MEIKTQVWGKTPDGKDIKLYTLTNSHGVKVQLSDIGAGIVSIVTPDRNGHLDDIVLGYSDPLSYYGDGPCAGKTPGRFANRIANGRFKIDDKEYQLELNTGDGKHHLHGGSIGFANQKWASRISGESVVFTYLSADGEAGYPAELVSKVYYTLNDENELNIRLCAYSSDTTIVNLTNHTYFNLKGEGQGDILDHQLKLNASRWLPATDELITTGEMASVTDTPMDFTEGKLIGRDIREPFDALVNGKGYDSCWVLDDLGKDKLNLAAELWHDGSGRKVQLYTTQPGIQVYTGNWLSGCPQGKNGHVYHDYEGVALECQALPDSPNKPNFPNTFLRAGDEYKETIIFKFLNI
ncbi:MAG: galactose mutarotase [Bacteroidales bacterium]|nr:galactose mutarotase [Bacteroidales bacterium]